MLDVPLLKPYGMYLVLQVLVLVFLLGTAFFGVKQALRTNKNADGFRVALLSVRMMSLGGLSLLLGIGKTLIDYRYIVNNVGRMDPYPDIWTFVFATKEVILPTLVGLFVFAMACFGVIVQDIILRLRMKKINSASTLPPTDKPSTREE